MLDKLKHRCVSNFHGLGDGQLEASVASRRPGGGKHAVSILFATVVLRPVTTQKSPEMVAARCRSEGFSTAFSDFL